MSVSNQAAVRVSGRAAVSSEAGMGKSLLSSSLRLLAAFRAWQGAEQSLGLFLAAHWCAPCPVTLVIWKLTRRQLASFQNLQGEGLWARMVLQYYVASARVCYHTSHPPGCVHWLEAGPTSCSCWGGGGGLTQGSAGQDVGI